LRSSRFIPALAWLLLSLVLLCLPGSTLPQNAFFTKVHADKWIHIFLFGTLCLLWCRCFRENNGTVSARRGRFLWVTLLVIVYGAAMEFVQEYWIPNRSFELADIGADAVGAVLGFLISWRRWGLR